MGTPILRKEVIVLKDIKVIRLQAIGGNAILIISDEWLYATEKEDKLILTKEPIT